MQPDKSLEDSSSDVTIDPTTGKRRVKVCGRCRVLVPSNWRRHWRNNHGNETPFELSNPRTDFNSVNVFSDQSFERQAVASLLMNQAQGLQNLLNIRPTYELLDSSPQISMKR